VKATLENPRGSVEKLSPKESVEGADTVLRGSLRAPKGFSEGKPEAAKPRGRSPRGFVAKGLPKENFEGTLILPRSTV
jgi:hypothetical protein